MSIIRKGEPLLGTFLMFNSLFAAQIIGSSGFDCIVVDMEHSPVAALEATHIVHAVGAASAGKCAALVRVPSHGVEWIKWGLDCGSAGIVVPMVNTKEEAGDIVQRARYPPLGQRSFGPIHAPWAHPDAEKTGAGYLAQAAPNTVLFLMIESAEGVRNVEEILATKGVSGGFVGPVDLRLSLGLAGFDGEEEEFIAALKKIVAAADEQGKPVGIFAGSEKAVKRAIEIGFSFLLCKSDYSMLAEGAAATLETGRAAIERRA
ncbi:hypothetical protein B7463_g10991, partial [Scytalidium lignicola]